MTPLSTLISDLRRLQGYYFSQDFRIKNLGDALGAVVVNSLGYQLVATNDTNDVSNPGRCLIPIGSTLDSSFIGPMIQRLDHTLDFWGCGWRGNWLDSTLLESVRIHAVRGPITHRRFNLNPTVPRATPQLQPLAVYC